MKNILTSDTSFVWGMGLFILFIIGHALFSGGTVLVASETTPTNTQTTTTALEEQAVVDISIPCGEIEPLPCSNEETLPLLHKPEEC